MGKNIAVHAEARVAQYMIHFTNQAMIK